MSRSRFVKPEITRLYLADVHKRAHEALLATGKATKEDLRDSEANVAAAIRDNDYIDVRRRLNTGERQALFARMAPNVTAGETVKLDSKEVMTAKVMAYLLAWSLTDEGQPVPVSLSAVHSLDPETFREIRAAIEAHEDAIDQEMADQKKVPSGGSTSSATSTSVAP